MTEHLGMRPRFTLNLRLRMILLEKVLPKRQLLLAQLFVQRGRDITLGIGVERVAYDLARLASNSIRPG